MARPANKMVALNVDNARRHHRSAVWFANTAKKYGWGDARIYADKLRKEAWEFLAEARRIKQAGDREEAA